VVGSSQKLVLIFAFGCPIHLPNFSLIEARVSELERFCVCMKRRVRRKKEIKLKFWSLVSQKQLARFSSNLEYSLPL